MLNEEEKKVVEYLRMSPKDSLKRDAADLIERLGNDGHYYKDRMERVIESNGNLVRDIEALENKKSSIWQAIKDKFK